MSRPLEPGKRGIFFPAFAAVLLLFVLLGFSRTLYLKPWFPSDPLPAYLYVHGFVLTAWYAFFLSQTLLVARGKLLTHRRMGIIGVGLASAVLAVALMAVFGIVGRFKSLGIDVQAEQGQISFIVWSDLGALAAFATFITRGALKRNVSASHKRLMLLGSISLMAPAFIRVSSIPPFDQLGGVVFTLGALLATAGALLIYDLVTLRRIHQETLWGVPLFFIVLLGAAFLMPGTAIDTWLLSNL
jgi:hypothetical protein